MISKNSIIKFSTLKVIFLVLSNTLTFFVDLLKFLCSYYKYLNLNNLSIINYIGILVQVLQMTLILKFCVHIRR